MTYFFTDLDTSSHSPHVGLELVRLQVSHHLLITVLGVQFLIALPDTANEQLQILRIVGEDRPSQRADEQAVLGMTLLHDDGVPAVQPVSNVKADDHAVLDPLFKQRLIPGCTSIP